MSIKLLIGLFACIVNIAAIAQQGEKKTIRVVDSLSAQEKANRNPILLHTELDSLIKYTSKVCLSKSESQILYQPLNVVIIRHSYS